MRVWIETIEMRVLNSPRLVTLYVRVWIETKGTSGHLINVGSPST